MSSSEKVVSSSEEVVSSSEEVVKLWWSSKAPCMRSVCRRVLQTKIIWDLSYCDICNKLIVHGSKCRGCNKKCHRGCIQKLTTFCEKVPFPEKQLNAETEKMKK